MCVALVEPRSDLSTRACEGDLRRRRRLNKWTLEHRWSALVGRHRSTLATLAKGRPAMQLLSLYSKTAQPLLRFARARGILQRALDVRRRWKSGRLRCRDIRSDAPFSFLFGEARGCLREQSARSGKTPTLPAFEGWLSLMAQCTFRSAPGILDESTVSWSSPIYNSPPEASGCFRSASLSA